MLGLMRWDAGHTEQRELRAYSSDGSYLSTGTDVQAKVIFAGSRPTDDLDAWGYEREDRWGIMRTAEPASSTPSEQGRHHNSYTAFATAVATETPPQAPAAEATAVLQVIEAARTRGLENRVVSLSA
jgi:predicted dehydrogenase